MSTTTSTHHSPFTPENVKPNPHPYAIRTTSTGVLSRSNSIPNKGENRNRYVPPSPSREDFGIREGETKRMQGRPGHRYSRSLTGSDSPMPIPLPVDEHGGIIFPRSSSPVKELGRAHTGGSYPSSPTKDSEQPVPRAHTGGSFPTSSTAMPQLPLGTPDPSPTNRPLPLPPQFQSDLGSTNPKDWTPYQVAAYLTTALRTRNDGEDGPMLPMAIVQDITHFIKKEQVTGRIFLHLTDTNLEEMHINSYWKTPLLSASRALKQKMLQDQIWGFGSTSASSPSAKSHSTLYYTTADEDEVRTTPQRRPLPPEPFPTHDGYISSSSSTSSNYESRGRSEGRYRNGRVRGMVETFERERSRSESEGSDVHSSPRKQEQRPLPVPPQARPMEPEEEMEYFDFGGTAKPKKGSVREHGKFSSVRGSRMTGTGSRRRPVGADLFANDSAPPSAQSILASYTVEEPPSLKGPIRATTTHSHTPEDEPTIEELLAAEESQGAMAWEAIEMGETVKRITQPDVKLLGGPRVSGARAWEEEEGRDTIKPAAPSANAIPDFTVEQVKSDEDASRRALSDEGVVVEPEPEPAPSKEEEKRAKEEEVACAELEATMAKTRSMIAALSKRVEDIENEISAMEARAAARAERAPKVTTPPPSIWATLSKIFSDPRRAMVDLSKLVGMKQPRSVRNIPPYLLFVSLGMCAVVLKVVIKRTGGAITRR